VGAPFPVSLGQALRDIEAARAVTVVDDPLKLDVPPDDVDGATLEPKAAAALGSLYLLSELEQVNVVSCAELLAAERYSLGLRDGVAVQKLEDFAARQTRRPAESLRHQLFARLFGARLAADRDSPHLGRIAITPVPTNEVFEELLAGYCDALVGFDVRTAGRSRSALRMAGDRLRGNLTPRQYGNTLLIAPQLVEQLRESLTLLGLPAVGQLFGTTGAWGVVRALQRDAQVDIGRRVDRGQSGQSVIASVGYPSVPDLVESALGQAADVWLTATGCSANPPWAG
jgi:hypothetical protein